MPRVIASIEARMASSRLPGKVMMDVHGRPVIARIVDRLRRCRRIHGIVLATTTNSTDDVLSTWSKAAGVACHRGSDRDVLQRVVDAQHSMNSDIVVEVCGDTPLLDPGVIDRAVETFLDDDCDVVSNTWTPSFPQGIDAQVFRLSALEDVAATIDDPAVREHVSLYFYEHPERYRIHHLTAPPKWQAPELRLQLDYAEDLSFITRIYQRLEPAHGGTFGIDRVLELLAREPALAEINRHCRERPAR